MKSFPKLHPRLGALLLAAMATTSAAHAAIVFQDNFSYADGTAFINSGGWVSAYAGNPTITSLDGGSNSAVAFNNRGAYHTLSSPVTTDFTLTVSMVHNNYSRTAYVVLSGDDAGSGVSGYGFQWNSSSSGSFSGQGFLQLRKFSNITTFSTSAPGNLNWDDGSTAANSATVASAGAVLQPGDTVPTLSSQFSTFTLRWVASTNTLSVTNALGTIVSTEVDNDFASFSRIYLSGGTTVYFDSITLDAAPAAVPEPSAAAGLAGLGCLGVVALRRRRRLA